MQSESRGGARVRLLAIHTTEGIMRAADLRAWKTWAGSSHASADQYGVLLDGPGDGFVSYDRASWTLRSGNAVSDNLELCALAKWTRADWLARPKLLEGAAIWLARRAAARPWIPLVKLSPAEVRAGKAGVIGHNDWTVGMKDGTHWDPGPGFPWELVLARAKQIRSGLGNPAGSLPVQEDIVTPDDIAAIARACREAIMERPLYMDVATETGQAEATSVRFDQAIADQYVQQFSGMPNTAWGQGNARSFRGVERTLAAMQGQLVGMQAALAQSSAGQPIDLAAVLAASKAGTLEALAEGTVEVDVTVTGPRTAADGGRIEADGTHTPAAG